MQNRVPSVSIESRVDTKQIECLDRSNAIISANKLASSVSKQISNEMERANESEGAMKRWKNREVRSISKSKSDRWLVSVLTRFARPANQSINLKGIFLWNWDIDLSISPLAGSGRGLGGNFNPRSFDYISLSPIYWKWEVGDIFGWTYFVNMRVSWKMEQREKWQTIFLKAYISYR